MTTPLLALLLAAAPIECPPGTSLRGGAPPEQYEAWCEGPGPYGRTRREGPSRTWYDDGGVWTDERWAEGKRQGPFLERHRNGKPARQGQYEQDEKVGEWTIWYESGQVEEVQHFTRNVPDGPFTAWHRNGRKKAEGRHCLGAQCGTWVSWDEGGREIGRVTYAEQRSTP